MNTIIISLSKTVPEGRVFGLDSQTLIQIGIQLLNGIILAVVLAFVLYIPVKEFMRKRSEKIQSGIEDADAAMEKANALIAEYEAKVEDIHQERLEILQAAHRKAEDESKVILKEAATEASKIKKRSLESVAEDKKRLQEEMRLQIIDLSYLIAERYVSMNLDDEAQNQYFDQAITQLEGHNG